MSRDNTGEPKPRRVVWRVLGWAGALFGLLVVVLLATAWKAMGTSAIGARRARMEASPQWRDGHFENPEPLVNDLAGSLLGMLHASPDTSPTTEPATVAIVAQSLATPPVTGLRVTWLGHASMLVEIDGQRVLTDPVWSERVSPISWLGPRRWYTPRIALDALPPIDAVVISHDHYDHLDYATIVALNERKLKFVVPLGIGAHLAYWGVPEARIVELDWWERTRIGALEIVATPARHASGRTLFDKDATLWASYALLGAQHRVFFSGDTGLFPALHEIGERLGPFDLTMIETGQYHRAWPDWHIGPEQAVRAHQLLRGRAMLPMHWGLFALAYHGWTEPIERVLAAATSARVQVIAPKPGESVEPERAATLVRWWPTLSWESAAQHPIVSTWRR
jgi:L-ascorbate metabolism protein UlaG (beta-lactamase superfamily)